VPDSKLSVRGVDLGPSVSDEEFFALHEFRTTRFHVVVPECSISGVEFSELLQRKGYRAGTIRLFESTVDALVDRDKPSSPFIKTPLMPNEALATLEQPLQVDSLIVTNGYITYAERLAAGTAPGVLTFGTVNLAVQGIANRLETSAAMVIHAESKFMNSGSLALQMSIPVASKEFSAHYSGSLGAMDLTLLNAFFERAEHLRLKSGSTKEAAFDIDVNAGQARGNVRATYANLETAVLDKMTGTEKGLENRLSSLLLNAFKIRKGSAPNASGLKKTGLVNYTRGPEDEFLQFLWFALRTGILDIISH
jgi:hypothetical protein